jgi:ADP-heptose:LPS heptosyltransferase
MPPLPQDWTARRVAVLLSPALGDALVMMIVAHNLARSGADVTVYGSQAMALRDWFADVPRLTIASCALPTDVATASHGDGARSIASGSTADASSPVVGGAQVIVAPPAAAAREALAVFDVVVQLHRQKPIADLDTVHHCAVVLEPVFGLPTEAAMVDRMQAVCRTLFGCTDARRENGLQAPAGLQRRRDLRRVAIHPMASTTDKCWLPARFIALANRLRADGFAPYMILAPHERAEWAPRLAQAGVPIVEADSLSALAAWIYESGWFIGNDSGIGHLASNLGVPTLSLFMRKGIARTWRPSWGVGRVLIGSQGIPTGKLKERLWKYALTVARVRQAFIALRGSALDGPTPAPDAGPAARGVDSGAAQCASAAAPSSSTHRAETIGTPCVAGPVAIAMSNAIGDTLVMMVVVRNLLRQGVSVTVYGRTAHALRSLFPDVDIVLPPEDDDAYIAVLRDYPTVLQMHDHQPIDGLAKRLSTVRTLRETEYAKQGGCMAERFAEYARHTLGVAQVSIDNGMVPPAGKQHRLHRQRVVIHPEATTDDKRWGTARFIRLAALLRRQGYEPHFVLAPHERARWPQLAANGISAPQFGNLYELAEWIYESGWFIGNDSGIGHLASNLGIPTLSLFRRRGNAQRWKPAWGQAQVALGWQWLPGASMKERYWRQTLRCTRVMRQFRAVVKSHD